MRNDAAKVTGEGWRPWLVGAGVALVAFWCLFPLYWTLKASFMDESAIIMGVAHNAGGFTFDNYLRVLGLSTSDSIFGGQTKAIMTGFVNSALVALPAAAAGTAIATLAGYVLGRFEFPFKGPLLYVLLASRTLPPIALLFPYYVFFAAIGLAGSLFGLWIVYLTAVIPLLSWVLMGYFASLPVEIERAARMDGCTRWQMLRHVTLPMAMPGIAAAFIIAFLVGWNDLLFAIVLTGGTSAQTLSASLLGLSPLMPGFRADLGLFAAASMLAALPPLALAMLFQRFITNLNIVDPVTSNTD